MNYKCYYILSNNNQKNRTNSFDVWRTEMSLQTITVGHHLLFNVIYLLH